MLSNVEDYKLHLVTVHTKLAFWVCYFPGWSLKDRERQLWYLYSITIQLTIIITASIMKAINVYLLLAAKSGLFPPEYSVVQICCLEISIQFTRTSKWFAFSFTKIMKASIYFTKFSQLLLAAKSSQIFDCSSYASPWLIALEVRATVPSNPDSTTSAFLSNLAMYAGSTVMFKELVGLHLQACISWNASLTALL